MGVLPIPGRVAVIGLGVSGIVAVKNLIEQGFDVFAFERNDYIGGLWQFNDDRKRTTVLHTTHTNASKQFTAFTDFPFPDDYPIFPSSDQVAHYIRSYAKHFNLDRYFRLGVTIDRIARSKTGSGWAIHVRGSNEERVEEFDRVLITTGPFGRPFVPRCEGMDRFEGEVLHSQAYKGPYDFVGKRVVVVGIGDTACDIAVDLYGTAKQVYLSHRSGARIMPRFPKGQPVDHAVTRRLVYYASFLDNLPGWLADKLTELVIDREVRSMWPPFDPKWRLLPAPPIEHSDGVVNDHLIPDLTSGAIISLSGITRFTNTSIVADDQEVHADVAIFCTGSHFDYSFLDPLADPTKRPTPEWDNAPYQNGLPYPWLYQTIFSTTHPESLAFIGPCLGFTFSSFLSSDLTSQAIAQIWSGSYPLPSQNAMEDWCVRNYRRSVKLVQRWRVSEPSADSKELERWLNDVAGNRINEKLGWEWEGWEFWWKERELYRLIMDGVNSPFVYRLFEGAEGGRRRWDGARAEIYRANGMKPTLWKDH